MVEQSKPVVAVWKSAWLPPSETFVAHQLAALQRWDPIAVGLRTVPAGLPVTVALAPFSLSVSGKLARRVSAALGHRWGYDRVLRRSGARLIHAHFGSGGIAVLPIARRLRLPLIVTFHGYDVNRAPLQRGRAGRTYRRGLEKVFAQASSLVAVSEFIGSRLIDLGAPAEKVVVRYVGTPLTPSPPLAERSGVVFVGRLVEVKGVADLLAAVALLPQSVRAVTPVVIVGYGPELESLTHLADRLGIDAEFTGRKSSAEVAQILARSAVFCGPSRRATLGDTEAFGTVFLEAALQELPVVSYRTGGVPEAVEDGVTGTLVEEGDVEGLSRSLMTYLTDERLAARTGAAGRQRVIDRFSIDTCTSLLEDLYDDVVTTFRG